MHKRKLLITGAGSGLGRVLSFALADASFDLCLLSKSKQKLQTIQDSIHSSIIIYAVDLANELELDQVLNHLINQNFIPDIIIHCAGGGFKMHDPLLPKRDFCRLLDVNLTSIVQINSKLLPAMLDRGSGVVIHIGSTAAHSAHGSVAYNTAKAALAAYVRSLGRSLAAEGVIVTGISPGSFVAEGNNMSRFQADQPGDFAAYVDKLPAKRMTESEEFIQIIQMLCNQKTPLFSGCMLPVDAGEGMSYIG